MTGVRDVYYIPPVQRHMYSSDAQSQYRETNLEIASSMTVIHMSLRDCKVINSK
jgi:hypothetical protein